MTTYQIGPHNKGRGKYRKRELTPAWSDGSNLDVFFFFLKIKWIVAINFNSDALCWTAKGPVTPNVKKNNGWQ